MTFLVSLRSAIIKLPNAAQKEATKNYYRTRSGLPNVVGSIDGSHIKIDTPSERAIDYFNRKSFYSIILQAVCNKECRFLDVFIGYPRSVHDARVFRNSSFYENIHLLCESGEYVLGDSAYLLMSNLITPYRNNGHLTALQKHFNKTVSSCPVHVDCLNKTAISH